MGLFNRKDCNKNTICLDSYMKNILSIEKESNAEVLSYIEDYSSCVEESKNAFTFDNTFSRIGSKIPIELNDNILSFINRLNRALLDIEKKFNNSLKELLSSKHSVLGIYFRISDIGIPVFIVALDRHIPLFAFEVIGCNIIFYNIIDISINHSSARVHIYTESDSIVSDELQDKSYYDIEMLKLVGFISMLLNNLLVSQTLQKHITNNFIIRMKKQQKNSKGLTKYNFYIRDKWYISVEEYTGFIGFNHC